MYYLSLGARESWGVTSFRAKAIRFESLWFRSIERSDLMSCLLSKEMDDPPFYSPRGSPLLGS
jgi:hypothetical protein